MTALPRQELDRLLGERAWLTSLARKLVRDEDDADDLVQETLVRAVAHRLDPERSLRPWLATVLRNTWRMRWRGQVRRLSREHSAHEAQTQERLPSPEDALHRLQVLEELARALRELPEPYRTALVLRYGEGLSASEIASRLQVPSATVRSQLLRGRQIVRDALGTRIGSHTALGLLAVLVEGPPSVSIHSAAASTVAHSSAGLGSATGASIMTTKKLLTAMALAGSLAAGSAYTFWPAGERAARAASTSLAEPAPRIDGVTTPRPTAKDERRPMRISRERYESLRRQIQEALRKKQLLEREPASPRAAPALPGPSAPPEVEVIRERVREVVPLVRECYELALETSPGLEGTLIVAFEIIGDPEIGGVIETSEIAEESSLRHPELEECVTESMYSIEVDPPPGGGRMKVRYPMQFKTEGS